MSRSHWGWGEQSRALSENRQALADRLEREVGFPELKVRNPTPLADATLPKSQFEASNHQLSLPDAVTDFCTTDRETRIRHTYGKSYPDLVRGFAGSFESAPDAVARPRTEAELQTLLEWASDNRVAIVPFGGGTSVVGGVEPDLNGVGAMRSGTNKTGYNGVVSVSMQEFTQVEVDEHSRRARLGAGLLGPEVNEKLGDYGLQLRHYPQSYEYSTVGGWIATRAGGHFATLYTHIDDFVESVRAVTPVGVLETLDIPASGAGPDPNRFLLGSEGAFGCLTEAWVRVQPRPEYRASVSVEFADFWDGVAAAREIVQARLYPANCRLLDPVEVLINELDATGSVLVLGFESFDHAVADDLARAIEICEKHSGEPESPRYSEPGGTTEQEQSTDEDTAADWRNSFFDGPYLFNELGSIGVLVDTFETAVTWDRFPDLHAALQREVMNTMVEECGTGVLSCRFTHVYPDGPAPYYTLLAPAERGNELEQWRAIKATASDVLAEHNATITHHHAVGRVHREWYAEEVPDHYTEALRSMKRTLDPEGVMNPGALL